MTKRVAVLQSNYIPWKGYFDIINRVDVFCFHDDLQYTKNDWRNRNKIKTRDGVRWLTIPCGTSEKRLISEVKINDFSWQKKHWETIKSNYSDTPFFSKTKDFFEDFYLSHEWNYLSELNQYLIKNIAKDKLGIKDTVFLSSKDYNLQESKTERLIQLLLRIGATDYLSGPSAINYLDLDLFKKNNIKIEFINYSNYPIYSQYFPPFDHNVSVLDLIFNEGDNLLNFITSSDI